MVLFRIHQSFTLLLCFHLWAKHVRYSLGFSRQILLVSSDWLKLHGWLAAQNPLLWLHCFRLLCRLTQDYSSSTSTSKYYIYGWEFWTQQRLLSHSRGEKHCSWWEFNPRPPSNTGSCSVFFLYMWRFLVKVCWILLCLCFFFFLKWVSAYVHQFHSLGQGQSMVAQQVRWLWISVP